MVINGTICRRFESGRLPWECIAIGNAAWVSARVLPTNADLQHLLEKAQVSWLSERLKVRILLHSLLVRLEQW